MKYKQIEDCDLDKFSKEELDTILVAFHDGDDQSVYNWSGIVNLLSESDIEVDGEMKEGYDVIKGFTPSKIIDTFYNELELNGNNAVAVIFSEGKYWQIHWQSTY